jgi:uncharacterized membrane protein
VPKSPKKDDPLRILKRRFASGEINEEEYRHKKSVLEEDVTKLQKPSEV